MTPKQPSISTSVYKHSPDFAWRRVDDESVILNVETSDYYSLDPVATYIWETLGKKQSPNKIAAAIAKKYGISAAKACKDTEEFVNSLLKEKLLLP